MNKSALLLLHVIGLLVSMETAVVHGFWRARPTPPPETRRRWGGWNQQQNVPDLVDELSDLEMILDN
uniref:Uncharacterized protein n=1 Tax=Ciona intestinalis TaxID=7719 RepID=H2XNW4_CIOIN